MKAISRRLYEGMLFAHENEGNRLNQPIIQPLEPRRLLTAGQIDPLFGSIEKDVPGGTDSATQVVVDPAGRVVLGGTWQQVNAGAQTGVQRLAISRYLFDGSPDPRFGANGVALVSPHGLNHLVALRRLSDGRLLVVGTREDKTGGGNQFMRILVARLTVSGKVDRSFASDGVATIRLPTNGALNPAASEVTADGKIIIGESFVQATGVRNRVDVALAKVNVADGSLDSSFGSGGIATSHVGLADRISPGLNVQHDPAVSAIHVRNDGSIDVGFGITTKVFADINANDTHSAGVAHFNTAGDLDITFGTKGLAEFAFDIDVGEFPAVAFGFASDGKTLVSATQQGVSVFHRFTANGKDDTTLNPGAPSPAERSFPNFEDRLNRLLQQPDGKWLAAGQMDHATSATLDLPVARRFNADLSIDTTFGDSSRIVLDQFTFGELDDLAIGSDGAILAAGFVNNGDTPAISTRSVGLRLFPDDGPLGLLAARNVNAASSVSNRLIVQWRSDEPIDIASLGNDDLDIVSPLGQHYRARLVDTLPSLTQSGIVQGTYKLASPGGSWDAADNGVWTVSVRQGAVQDKDGDGATGRVIGTFVVHTSASSIQRP